MKKLLILITAILLCSCSKKFYPPASVQDNIRVETHYEYIEKLRDTTIYVSVPREIEKIVTTDTISYLENTVAYSEAAVSNGFLSHSLVNKRVSLPAVIQVKEVETVRDSIVYRDRTETIIKEVNKLTWWQKTKMKGFWVFLTVFLLNIAYKTIIKRFNFLKIWNIFK